MTVFHEVHNPGMNTSVGVIKVKIKPWKLLWQKNVTLKNAMGKNVTLENVMGKNVTLENVMGKLYEKKN